MKPQSTIDDINDGNTTSIILDKLTICFNDPNQEHVLKTAGLLISDHIDKTPGLRVTQNQRYKASCRLSLPFEGISKETICFEAGPRSPNQPSYRLDFNPSKLSKAGLDDLIVFLNSTIDPDPLELFHSGRVTRADIAIDLPGYHLEDVIVRTSRLQKHGVYADRYGAIETTYLGTPRSNRVVAYEKPIEGSVLTRLRLERRLKPRCFGYQLAALENPFGRVELIPAEFAVGVLVGIPGQFITDSIRIGGLKRASQVLDPSQRKVLIEAHKQATSLLPSLDDQWAAWPQILIGYGLGKELGAVPINGLGKGFSVNGKVAKPLIGQECPGDLQGSPPTWPTNGGLPSNNTLHDSKAM